MGDRDIWVVIGTTGEYSDRMAWLTRAFFDEESAKEYVLFLATERQKLPPRGDRREDREKVEASMQAFDAEYIEDYTGTSWYVEKVALSEAAFCANAAKEGDK